MVAPVLMDKLEGAKSEYWFMRFAGSQIPRLGSTISTGASTKSGGPRFNTELISKPVSAAPGDFSNTHPLENKSNDPYCELGGPGPQAIDAAYFAKRFKLSSTFLDYI